MNISEIAKLITEKNYVFQVSIPNTQFMHGKTTVQSALVDTDSIENYLNKIVDRNKAKNILVRLYTPNGSSYKLRGEHLIFLDSAQPVATQTTDATKTATTTTHVATPPLNGLNNYQTESPKMNITDQINYGVLQAKHELLVQRSSQLENENKELRKKVDILHDEKLQLVKDQSVLAERAKLDIDKAKFEVQQEAKGGLTGLMSEVNENPEIVKMLLGALVPNHPMFKEGFSGTDNNTKQIQQTKYHDNPDINTILTDLPNTLKTLDGEKIAKVYVIFQSFMSAPEKIETVYDLVQTK